MEYREQTNSDEEIFFRDSKEFLALLDSLSTLYSLSEDKFVETYKRLPYPVIKFMRDSRHFLIEDEVVEYTREIHSNYLYAINKINKVKYEKFKEFTLRNFHDLQEFLDFLNKMLYLYKISPGHFMKYFPMGPKAYWDKIDDLRETSFKIPRDSLDYIESLKKCKQVSFLYSNYMDYLSANKLITEEW
jgi:hypothetical protein